MHFGDCLGSVVVMLYSGNVKMMHSVLGDVTPKDLEIWNVCVWVCVCVHVWKFECRVQ